VKRVAGNNGEVTKGIVITDPPYGTCVLVRVGGSIMRAEKAFQGQE
jgi:hypothetical protein